uniref:Protein-serine/threonine kinase n=1 Tax=Bionectria ochroleuca TaxID=29856 RepID=A0A8H7NDD1_BIOOC
MNRLVQPMRRCRIPSLAHYPTCRIAPAIWRCSSFSTASPGSETGYNVTDADIMALSKLRQHSLSLADLVKHGRPPLSEKSLLSSANFTLSLLPIRLAHRLQALRNLPYIVVSNPNISRIYSTYLNSLSILLPYWRAAAEGRPIHSLEEEIRFTNTLAELVAMHTDTIPILARGFLECRRYISPPRSPPSSTSTCAPASAPASSRSSTSPSTSAASLTSTRRPARPPAPSTPPSSASSTPPSSPPP